MPLSTLPGFSTATRAGARFPVLSPEEETSLYRDVLGAGMGGLQYVGETLDKPGRAIRGLLAGDFGELLNLLPFSDMMGITDPRDQTTGRDLLHEYGLATENDPDKWEVADFTGFGAEVLLDPLTYMTFGASALGKTGHAVRKAGLLDNATAIASKKLGRKVGKREARMSIGVGDILDHAKTANKYDDTVAKLQRAGIEDIVGAAKANEPLGGVLGIGPPMGASRLTAGSPGVAKTMDIMGDAFSKLPAIRHTRALFEKGTQGQSYGPAQDILADLHQTKQQAGAQVSQAMFEDVRKVKGFNDPAFEREIVAYNELGDRYREVHPDMKELPQEAKNQLDLYRTERDGLHAELNANGIALSKLESDRILHAPREYTAKPKFGEGTPSTVFDTSPTGTIGKSRVDAIREIDRETIERLVEDTSLQGMTVAGRTQHIAGLIPELTDEEAAELAKWVKGREGRQFGLHPAQEQRNYMRSGKGLLATSKSIQGLFKDVVTAEAKEGMVPLSDAVAALGTDKLGNQTLMRNTENVANNLAQELGGIEGKFVPEEAIDAARNVLTKFQAPEEIGKLGAGIDKLTNLFKTGVTAWPAFHVRNMTSGFVQNIITDAFGILEAPKMMRMSKAFMNGDDVKGISQLPGIKSLLGDVTDAEATQALREMAGVHDIVQHQLGEIHGRGEGLRKIFDQDASPLDRLYAELPGKQKIGFRQSIKDATATLKDAKGFKGKMDVLLNPKGIAGVGGDIDTNVISKAHRTIGNYVEGINRVSAMIGMLNQGMDIAEVAKRIKLNHVDYTGLSNFERSVARRSMPFYSFTAGISKQVAKALTEAPGGKLAQTIRGTNAGRTEGFVPDYLGEGAAINLGDDKFLSGLGLMHESPLSMGVIGTNIKDTATRTLQKGLSMMNPLAKGPLEVATNTQFFTGRPLDDLYNFPFKPAGTEGDAMPIPGGRGASQLANTVLANSPLSRLFSTGRKLIDERKNVGAKAVSTLTGLKVTDVDMARSKELAAVRASKELLRDSPNIREFTRQYVPEGQVPTPTEEMLLRLQSTSAKRAKEMRKKAALSR